MAEFPGTTKEDKTMLDLRKLLKEEIEVAEQDLEDKEKFRSIVSKTLELKIFGDHPRDLAYQIGIGTFSVIRFAKGKSSPLSCIKRCFYRHIKRKL